MPPEVSPAEEPQRPRVSIVIVSYNCAEALRRCLTALEAANDREHFEILTVDAGSSDASPRIDAEFPRITVLRLPRNFGRTRARNIGMRTAQADLICFLDPYVELSPNTLHLLASALESHPEATAAAPSLSTPDGALIPSTFLLPTPAQLAETAFSATPLPAAPPVDATAQAVDEAVLLLRRGFVAGMNYLDEKRFSEYWSLLEVCWQIRNAGKKLLFLPDASATLHPGRDRDSLDKSHIADRVAGAAAYIAKHSGLSAGISFRLKCFFSALGSFRLPLAFSILLGQRIDPTQ